jgi:hypothetical protein
MRRLLALPIRLVGDLLYEVVLGLELANELLCGEDED